MSVLPVQSGRCVDAMTDYREYRLSVKERIVVILLYVVLAETISLLFYDSFIPGIVGTPGCILFMRGYAGMRCRQRQRKLNMEFKELLLSLSANMAAGYSLERSFVPAYQELESIYQGRGYIQEETHLIIRGIEMRTDVVALLQDLGERSGLDDIREFARVTRVAKGTGGNLIGMMKKMVEAMEGRIAVEEEIETMITSKKLEQNIMSAMPFAIVLYMRVCNPGYMDALYGNIPGITAMSVCLLLIYVSIRWGRHIIDIQV